jgi:hypothetical protein
VIAGKGWEAKRLRERGGRQSDCGGGVGGKVAGSTKNSKCYQSEIEKSEDVLEMAARWKKASKCATGAQSAAILQFGDKT